MAFYNNTWYVNGGDGSTTGWWAVTKRPQNTAVAAGVIRRQFTTPAAFNEHCFVSIVAGTTANTTDASWTLGQGLTTVDGTVTWMDVTGLPPMNGDNANTFTWAQLKALGIILSTGVIIKRNSGASYQICTTGGTLGASEPAFSDTAGTTTSESGGSAVWTSLGVVGNFTTGAAAPHARIPGGANYFTAGATVFVGDNHSEFYSGNYDLSALNGGSSGLMCKVICHKHLGSYPPNLPTDLATGAVVGSSSSNLTVNPSGLLYVYGVTFRGGAALNIGSTPGVFGGSWQYYDNCVFDNSTGGGDRFEFYGPPLMVLNNTVFKFPSTNTIAGTIFAKINWRNTPGGVLLSGSAIPNPMFSTNNQGAGFITDMLWEGLDLSQLTGSLYSDVDGRGIGALTIKDCKLNASMVSAGTVVTRPTNSGNKIRLIRSDSAAAPYKNSLITFEGTESTETTITRVGGAADPSGQAQSRKVVTTADAQWLRPFRCDPFAAWNAVTSGNGIFVTVYGIWSGPALPNNDDIWMEVSYLGTSGSPLGSRVITTKVNVLAVGTPVPSDASVWNSAGGMVPFKLITPLPPQPQMAGLIYARVCVGKPSATFYIDPQVALIPNTLAAGQMVGAAAGVGATSAGWSPLQLTGVVGWWDAGVIASLNLTGSSINSVADQSGGGNTLNWSLGKPTFNATGLNSRPAIVLSGSSQALQAASFPMGAGNTLTFWYVGTAGNASSQAFSRILGYMAAGAGADHDNAGSWIFYRSNSTTLIFHRQGAARATVTPTADPAIHRFIGTVDSSGNVTIYVDGVVAGTGTTSGNWVTAGVFNVGRSGLTTECFAGPYGEIGVATGFTNSTDVANLDTYLKNKWGL
jgi:Concanavalin A-like lectin/glucanases superfamily